jgi:hypothetical protein
VVAAEVEAALPQIQVNQVAQEQARQVQQHPEHQRQQHKLQQNHKLPMLNSGVQMIYQNHQQRMRTLQLLKVQMLCLRQLPQHLRPLSQHHSQLNQHHSQHHSQLN